MCNREIDLQLLVIVTANKLLLITYYRFFPSYLSSFVGLAVPRQPIAQDKEKTKTNSASNDRLEVDESSQNTIDKENKPENEMESNSPGHEHNKFIASILQADRHLHTRPMHVRRISDSFKDITTLPNIKEE